MKRLGIFSGTFDPVHRGHIQFALKAAKEMRLDHVVFMPERRPRHKEGVTHYAHRVAMIRLAIRPYPQLLVLELPDTNFTISRTWPKLVHRFRGHDLFMLMGSDTAKHLNTWGHYGKMLEQCGLVIGTRGDDEIERVHESLEDLQPRPQDIKIVRSPESRLTSSAIRHDIERGKRPTGLTPTLLPYIKHHWLYIDIGRQPGSRP